MEFQHAHLISSVLLVYFWLCYSSQVLFGGIGRKLLLLSRLACLAVVILILTAPLNGWIFTIDAENLYHRGPLIWIYWIIAYPCEIGPSVVALFVKGNAEKKKAVALFAVMPVTASVLQMLFYGVTLTQVGVTCGLVLLYITLQSQEVNEARLRADMLDNISSTDALTGLRNRRAYDTTLDELEKEDWVGVVFLDLNGLKVTNDTLGHKAGDDMLCKFAAFLLEYFDHEQIFRISGDEFVVLCEAGEHFERRVGEMQKVIGDRAAHGVLTGQGKDVLALISGAEKRMYEDKHRYYIRTGRDRRTR